MLFSGILLTLGVAVGAVAGAPTAPFRLRVEYMNAPMGVDVAYQPRLTWALGHTDRSESQTAYRVAVSKAVGSEWVGVFDSGMVNGNVSQNVHLQAKLSPETLYEWTVQYTDSKGAVSDWATNTTFSTGVSGWAGSSWIGAAAPGCFQARKEITVAAKPIARATAYGVGLGYYKLYVDGTKVTTHELGAFTTYETRVYYDTVDLTSAMRVAGGTSHAIAASVGDGWYSQGSVHVGQQTMLFKIVVDYADGTSDTFGTDASWTVSDSPVTTVDIYKGETYNASMETPGWTTAGYHGKNGVWTPATVMKAPACGAGQHSTCIRNETVVVSSHAILPPIRIGESYTPCDMWESSPGVFVFDFCQNMAGFTTMRVPEGMATVAGAAIVQQHAEMIHGPKPAAIHNHYGNAPEINTYYTKGDGAAIDHTTMFTYAGFRYVSLKGFPGTPDVNTLTAHFVHTDYEMTGSTSFSDPLLTAVQHITRTAAMSNFQSIPTDCPQRERRGWLGDAQLSCETNMHNFDMGAAYTSFIQQIGDAQDLSGTVQDCVPYYGHGRDPADPAWGAAFAHIADWVGKYYHDDQIFSTHYSGITAHVEQLIATAAADADGGLLGYGGWSDWCPPDGCRACWSNGGKPVDNPSRNSVLVSSFYYISELRIVAKYAGILGKTADQVRYTKLAKAAAEQFNEVFYDASAKTYTEKRTCGEYLSPQTMISLAAHLEIIPAEDYEAVMDTLVDDVASHGWHLNVGIVGIKYLLPTLSAAGRGDVALMIAQVRTPPSYIYMVEQGATTLWETWTGSQYVPVASRNHIMFGSNSDWYFKYLAGIQMQPNSRGWQQLALKPEVWNNKRGVSICANLSSTEGSIATPRGVISTSWQCLQNSGSTGTCVNAAEKDTATLSCGSTIKSVEFAAYGTPTGTCSSGFNHTSSCDAAGILAFVKKACVGKSSCSFDVSNSGFHVKDPCFDTPKKFAATVTCAPAPPTPHDLKPVFAYTVNIPVGSTALVTVPQFGSKAAVAESAGPVWADGKFVSGVAGVAGGFLDGQENVVLQVGSGAYTFTVSA